MALYRSRETMINTRTKFELSNKQKKKYVPPGEGGGGGGGSRCNQQKYLFLPRGVGVWSFQPAWITVQPVKEKKTMTHF